MILNEEQQMLADLAERIFADKASVDTLRAIRGGSHGQDYDHELWQAMVESGLTGILVPEDQGGMDFGLVSAGLVAREVGRRLALTPFLSTAVLAAIAIGRGGNDEQKGRWLGSIAGGELIAALALDESAKHRPERVATEAQSTGDGYTISGAKTLVLDAANADVLLVSAMLDGTPRLFAVEAGDAGVATTPVVSLDTRSMADVRFDGAKAELLDGDANALDAVLDAGRAILAMELVGLARAVFERTLGYLSERKQFGQRIGAFQALQHRAAHLSVEIEISEAMAFQALAAFDAGAEDASLQILAAKARAAETARLASAEGVQMHGGMGMTDEFDIGFFMKRARAASELFGDANFCTERFARAKGY
ncbi:acyl-CoA dehydrogenase family protein [Salinisphaera sp.]|uniref:acyl-CoA dehydrogenase family protein n=1 Tax=Salinisphaera sp. TaxID=1914330 RepID=UPI000C5F90A9|nr:acyl-CoA dehydrogenase family protein [Salinisphaera sp.]MBS63697.1 acyl-CoA dehydrogenase [Salinisphaera sp.]